MASGYRTDIFLKKLYFIHEQCASAQKRKQDADAEASLDPFTRKRRQIAADVRQTKVMIHERNTTSQTPGSEALAAKQSNDIRLKMKDVQLNINKLNKIQRKKQRKLAKQDEPDEEMKAECNTQMEIVQCARQHLNELEKMERYGNDIEQAGLFGQDEEPMVYGDIPDIDDPQFKALIEGDKVLDLGLDDILAALQVVRAVAEEMNGELKAQAELMTKVEAGVGSVEEQIIGVNASLKEVLKKVRGPRQFFCDMLLCCVILGVAAAVIYLLVK